MANNDFIPNNIAFQNLDQLLAELFSLLPQLNAKNNKDNSLDETAGSIEEINKDTNSLT